MDEFAKHPIFNFRQKGERGLLGTNLFLLRRGLSDIFRCLGNSMKTFFDKEFQTDR